MDLEHFHPSQTEEVNPGLNSKLFESAYADTPKESERNNGKGANQAAEGDCRAEPKKEAPETPEQRLDKKITEKFGADVLEHMKDWDWLIDNRKKLEEGFKKVSGKEAADIAGRMQSLSEVDGKSLIYLLRTPGQTAGNLIPKRYDVYLRRGRLVSDDQVGHVYR